MDVNSFFSQPLDKVENVLWDKVIQFRILCLGCPWKTSNKSLWITNQACVEFRDTDIIKALVDVILWWCRIYVFDVSYPDGMVGILSFLEDIALECIVTIMYTRAQNM